MLLNLPIYDDVQIRVVPRLVPKPISTKDKILSTLQRGNMIDVSKTAMRVDQPDVEVFFGVFFFFSTDLLHKQTSLAMSPFPEYWI